MVSSPLPSTPPKQTSSESVTQSPPVQTPTSQQHQMLSYSFHLYPMIDDLAYAIETGTLDQSFDYLMNELYSHFENCKQLLYSISESLGSNAMTVDGQKQKLEEYEKLLNQRRCEL